MHVEDVRHTIFYTRNWKKFHIENSLNGFVNEISKISIAVFLAKSLESSVYVNELIFVFSADHNGFESKSCFGIEN